MWIFVKGKLRKRKGAWFSKPPHPSLLPFRTSVPLSIGVHFKETENRDMFPKKQKKDAKFLKIRAKCLLRQVEKLRVYAEKDSPHPQPPVEFGLSNVKPEPITFDV